MIYTNDEVAKRDVEWLTQECSLSAFAASRLTHYELTMMENKLTDISDKAILAFYADLFETFKLKKPHWKKQISEHMSPALAFIPGEGVRIVIEQEADGNWKSEGEDGVRSEKKYPAGTLFTSIKSERSSTDKLSAKAMFKMVAMQQKPFIVHAAIAALSINILALGTSFFSMQVYDRVIPTGGLSTLAALAIGVFIAIFLEMLLKLSRANILDHSTKKMDVAYSHDIFSRFLKIRLDALPKSIGHLSGQLQSYATVRSFISSAALYVLIDFPFALIFLAVIIMLAGWMMGLIVLVVLIISIFVGLFFRKKIVHLTKTSTMASHKKLGLLVESVENAENIKATGAGWSLLSRWNALTEDAINDDIEIRYYSEMSSYVSGFLQQFSYITLVATGAYIVSTTGELTMGGLIATTILSGRALSPISMLPNILVQWGRTKVSVEDLDNVYMLDRDNEGVERPLSPSVLTPHFSCNDIGFAYGEDSPTVKVQKLNIAPGERVAIVGMIGSGKSTLLKILSGMYKPQEGKILLNGIDMHHISRNRLNEMIGYLPQNVKLISGTLRDNLLLGLIGINDEKIMEAAAKTGLNQLINILPQGLDTPVPEGGESVSGGQKQMIAMTRLVLMEPSALLLDEPTANMDDHTERQILNTIHQQLTPESTLVIVTHKPALLGLVNRIVVMNAQGVVMDGPKDVVLKKLNASTKVKKQEDK